MPVLALSLTNPVKEIMQFLDEIIIKLAVDYLSLTING